MVVMTRAAAVHVPRHRPPQASQRAEQLALRVIADAEVEALPQRFVLFTDLHVQRSTMPVCVQLLRKVAAAMQNGVWPQVASPPPRVCWRKWRRLCLVCVCVCVWLAQGCVHAIVVSIWCQGRSWGRWEEPG